MKTYFSIWIRYYIFTFVNLDGLDKPLKNGYVCKIFKNILQITQAYFTDLPGFQIIAAGSVSLFLI